jgi:hypothetical protein
MFRRIAVPAVVTAGAFTLMSAVAFSSPDRTAHPTPHPHSTPDAAPTDTPEPADAPTYRAESLAESPAATPRPDSPSASPSASERPSAAPSGTPSAEPSETPHKGKHHGKHKRKPKHRKSKLRKGLEYVVPGLDQIPDWALPILADAEKHKSPGTTVDAHIDKHGNLVIKAKLQNTPHGLFSIAFRTAPDDDTVWVRIVVEDPTEATEETPTTITVTATDPVTDEVSTATAEVTAPEDAAETVTETIEDATAVDPASI